MKPYVSVILTVYNTARYLRQCLNTLISQSLKNIEIICIDDASEDNSVEILHEYQKKDKRISIITASVNKGINFTRNTGLKKACGKYVVILDSDDFYEVTFLEKLYLQAQKTKADITFCGFNVFDDEMQSVHQIDWDINRDILPTEDVFSMSPKLFNLTGTIIWNNLYKVEFLKQNNLKFENRLSYTDGVFSKTALLKAKRISYVDEKLVYYRVNNKNSFSHNLSVLGAIRLIYAWERLLQKENLFDKYCEAFFQSSLVKMIISFRVPEPYSSLLRSFYQKHLIPKFWKDAVIPEYYSKLKLLDNCSDTFKRFFFFKREKIIPIVLATDNCHLAETMVLLQSISEKVNPDYFYDIYVLHNNLSEEKCFNLTLLSTGNLRVSCINMAEKCHRKIRPQNYCLYIPELFAGYEKILYLDSGVLVINDLTKLIKINLQNKLVMGITKALVKSEQKRYQKVFGVIQSEVLESKILMLNLEMFQQNKLIRIMSKNFAVRQKKGATPSEIINFSCQPFIGKLPDSFVVFAYDDEINKYSAATEVLVYDLKKKIKKGGNFNFTWWKTARNSVFYEALINDYRMKLKHF